MFKDKLYRGSLGFVALVALSASSLAFAQSNDELAPSTGRPLKARSIRPFLRDEKPVNKVPNLYDKNSDEFDYFREELGRQETSSKTKKRLAELNSRVVYADPMDKPAYDGAPFVDIYADILYDERPFEDPEDPDVKFYDDEHNALALAIEALQQGTALLSLATGVDASNNSNVYGGGSGSSSAYPMPDPGSGQIMVSPSGGPVGSASGGKSGAEQNSATTSATSSFDDTKLVFPDDADAENPFKAEFVPVADEAFDFFKGDREFKPAANASGSGSDKGMGPNGQPMGSAGGMSGGPGYDK